MHERRIPTIRPREIVLGREYIAILGHRNGCIQLGAVRIVGRAPRGRWEAVALDTDRPIRVSQRQICIEADVREAADA